MSGVGWLPQLGHRTSRRAASGGAGPVQPPDFANLRVWLDGDDIDGSGNSTLTNGQLISSWKNKGSLGGTMDQATSGNQPTYRSSLGPGGKAAAEFDSNDWMTSSLASSDYIFMHDGTGCTIYTIARMTTSAVHTLVSTSTGTAIGIGHRSVTAFTASYFMHDGAGIGVNPGAAASTLSNGFFDVQTSILTSAATPNATIVVNGSTVATADAIRAFSTGAPSSTTVIRANPTGIQTLTGMHGGALIFSSAHDSTTRAAVLAYLASKAGVASFPTP